MSEYLLRGLNQRVEDLKKSNGHGLEVIMRQAAAVGRLASGATLKQFTDACFSDFEKAYNDAQQFAFNLAGTNEAVDQLHECASLMVNVIMEEVSNRLLHQQVWQCKKGYPSGHDSQPTKAGLYSRLSIKILFGRIA